MSTAPRGHSEQHPDDAAIPRPLRDALERTAPEVGADVEFDRAVLGAASAELARRSGRSGRMVLVRRAAGGVAVAACLGIAVLAWRGLAPQSPQSGGPIERRQAAESESLRDGAPAALDLDRGAERGAPMAARSPLASARAGVAEDLDNSGGVDMADALYIARRLEQLAQAPSRYDFTGDGAVDQADIDHVALRAVRLNGRDLR